MFVWLLPILGLVRKAETSKCRNHEAKKTEKAENLNKLKPNFHRYSKGRILFRPYKISEQRTLFSHHNNCLNKKIWAEKWPYFLPNEFSVLKAFRNFEISAVRSKISPFGSIQNFVGKSFCSYGFCIIHHYTWHIFLVALYYKTCSKHSLTKKHLKYYNSDRKMEILPHQLFLTTLKNAYPIIMPVNWISIRKLKEENSLEAWKIIQNVNGKVKIHKL